MTLSAATTDRLLSLGLGLASWSVLIVARLLTPSPTGHGTHRQLGLGQCTWLGLTGHPCPMCGMTTTFSHLAHAQPLEALRTQPFGVVLFLLTLAVAFVAILEGLAPRGRWRRILAWLEDHELRVASAMLVGLLAGWAYKLVTMGGAFAG